MSEPIYIGSATEKTGEYGQYIQVSFNRDDVQKLMDNLNEKGWVNLYQTKKKTQTAGKSTHSMKLSTPKTQSKPQTPKSVEEDFGADKVPY